MPGLPAAGRATGVSPMKPLEFAARAALTLLGVALFVIVLADAGLQR